MMAARVQSSGHSTDCHVRGVGWRCDVRRLSLSRRAKGVLAGVAFLFSVGAVSTKLLSGRTNEFCFCLPPVSQPAFTMPEATTADTAIHGGALPGRVVAAATP